MNYISTLISFVGSKEIFKEKGRKKGTKYNFPNPQKSKICQKG